MMKQFSLSGMARSVTLVMLACMFGFTARAQDAGGTSLTKLTTSSDSWYVLPWVWVVGVAAFILLLVALLNSRGGKKSAG